MNVLVINCGSSSLKYQLINSDTEAVLAKGLCERIGIDGRLVYQLAGHDKEITEAPMPTHKEGIQMVLDALVNPKTGAVKSLSEIDAVGHRVVHGGEKFAQSVVLNEEVLAKVEECNELAPLHNPANLIGIRVCQELMPGVPMVGVFDTAFHQTMPQKAYLYGLPYEYYEKYKVRRYGFHGTSHSFVSKRVAEIVGKPYRETYSMSLDMSGAVNQVLNYRDELQKNFNELTRDLEDDDTVRSFSPKCVIVIGKINTLNAKQQKAFELYRNSFNNLTIITFDELHQKICDLISVFKEDTPRPDDPLMDEFSIIDEDYPF